MRQIVMLLIVVATVLTLYLMVPRNKHPADGLTEIDPRLASLIASQLSSSGFVDSVVSMKPLEGDPVYSVTFTMALGQRNFITKIVPPHHFRYRDGPNGEVIVVS